MKDNLIVDCGIILYNPDNNALTRIMEYSQFFHEIYVFDNSPNKDIKHDVKFPENVVYLTEMKNIGLSAAYNKIIDKIGDNANFLCTLDQDSIFPAKEIELICSYIKNIDDETAIVGPTIIYGNEKPARNNQIVQERYVISSGSFINLEILKKTGIRYDEAYFIDRFDIDMCQQLINMGYKVIQYKGSFLYQRLGEDNGHVHPNHSALRHYYMFRNRFYFNNKFFKPHKRNLLDIIQTIRHIGLIIFCEDDKMDKLKQLPLAFRDYKKNNLG